MPETVFIKLGNDKNRVISFIHTRKRQHYMLMTGLIEPWFIVDGLLSYRPKNAGIGASSMMYLNQLDIFFFFHSEKFSSILLVITNSFLYRQTSSHLIQATFLVPKRPPQSLIINYIWI